VHFVFLAMLLLNACTIPQFKPIYSISPIYITYPVINCVVVAAVNAPIVVQVTQKLGIDARSFAMGVALATSIAFITPL